MLELLKFGICLIFVCAICILFLILALLTWEQEYAKKAEDLIVDLLG